MKVIFKQIEEVVPAALLEDRIQGVNLWRAAAHRETATCDIIIEECEVEEKAVDILLRAHLESTVIDRASQHWYITGIERHTGPEAYEEYDRDAVVVSLIPAGVKR